MFEGWKGRVLSLLRIPDRPHIPPGEEAQAEIFLAGRGFYAYLLLRWVRKQGGALVGLIFSTYFLHHLITGPSMTKWSTRAAFRPWVGWAQELFFVLEVLAWLAFLVQLLLTYIMVTWDYECRFYVLTDRCLRIQEGLWTFRAKTFSLANLQDLDVRKGPMQRLLGIGDLKVRTAGGGAEHQAEGMESDQGMHVGLIQGVADPDRIKVRLMDRMRHHRDAGLGESKEAAPLSSEHLEPAYRAVLEAARGLRKALEGWSS